MAKNSRKQRDDRHAVVVLGMHRSGTSALAGVLARLGCDAPKDLMPALPQNPKGFYESLSINSFNDTVLSTAGFTWYTWQEFNRSWFRSQKAKEMQGRISTLLAEAFGNARLIVLKDPRICLLLPFWRKALTKNGYQPLYILIHRHPVEVAGSIETWAAVSAERLPGYNAHYGQLLWLRHVLEAEARTRGERRHFTSYPRLLKDWRAEVDRTAEALKISWPSLSYHVEDSIAEFLDKSLDHEGRRVSPVESNQRMMPWVAATYEIMERWAETGEDPADHAALDEILTEFNRSAPTYSPLIEASRKAAFHLDVRARAGDAAKVELQDLRNRNAALTSEIAQRRAEADDVRLSAARAEQAVRDQLAKALREAREKEDEAHQRRREAEDRVQAMLSSTSWRLTGPLRRVLRAVRGSSD